MRGPDGVWRLRGRGLRLPTGFRNPATHRARLIFLITDHFWGGDPVPSKAVSHFCFQPPVHVGWGHTDVFIIENRKQNKTKFNTYHNFTECLEHAAGGTLTFSLHPQFDPYHC